MADFERTWRICRDDAWESQAPKVSSELVVIILSHQLGMHLWHAVNSSRSLDRQIWSRVSWRILKLWSLEIQMEKGRKLTGPKAPIVEGTKILSLYCLASSIMLCKPSMFTLTAKDTFCSPMALRSAEKWMIQSIRWVTTAFWSPLKSRISAKMYGPASTICWLGLMMSERITFSLPYFDLNKVAQACPSCPSPPEKGFI